MGKVFKVNEINSYIKRLFSEDILLPNVSIKGEISNFTHHTSGHMYFTLKDDKGSIKCVMFKGNNKSLNIIPKDGMSVVASGEVSVYEKSGVYQLYVRDMEEDGYGNLYLEFEKLKKKLLEEGLFDDSKKKEIPQFPEKIGIISSKTGAAIKDILNVLKRRYPIAKIYLYPSLVQGDKAYEAIVAGIETLDQMNLDTIIIARGGGSIEDLFVFNNEKIARAIYRANTPIITGIGHEIDYTIADFVSDLRAPTPSAAAEQAVPDILSLRYELNKDREKLLKILKSVVDYEDNLLLNIGKHINYLNPRKKIEANYQDLDNKLDKIIGKQRFLKKASRLELLGAKVKYLDPKNNLDRGYSMLLKDGKIVNKIRDIDEDQSYILKMSDGEINFTFSQINKEVK